MEIKFIPSSEYAEKNIPCPVPAKSAIPKWYKDIPVDKNNPNLKHCVPFLDVMMFGYIQTTWTDLYVREKPDGSVSVFDRNNSQIVDERPHASVETDGNFYKQEFVWQRHWSPTLPDGYSGIISHPANRLDLPFFTISAVVDFDKFNAAQIGNIPFYIKKGFSGIIPSGTPMFQIVPIKRDNWESFAESYSDKYWKDIINNRLSKKQNSYKKMYWQKKKFD